MVIDQLIRHRQQLPKSSATTSTRKTCNPQACTNQLASTPYRDTVSPRLVGL